MGLTTDQRGKARISGTTVDIGAFELQLLLTIAGGNNQSTTVNTAFADKLQIQVIDEFNNSVSLPGVTVELAALGTGAGTNPVSITATTDASGLATTTATANTTAGTYQVAATSTGITGVNFNLTNLSLPVIDTGDSTLVIDTGDSTLVIDTSDFTPVVIVDDSTPNNSPDLIPIPDFTPIWQSVIEELPQSGLEESACQTTPAIAINSTEEEGEITLDKEIETAIQRNQDCQPAGIEKR